MNRHEIRKEVFKAVFMNEFHDSEDINEIHDMFLNGRDAAEEEDLLKNNKSQEDEEYIKKKVEEISLKIPEIDAVINEKFKKNSNTYIIIYNLNIFNRMWYK